MDTPSIPANHSCSPAVGRTYPDNSNNKPRRQHQPFIPLSGEREISRARVRRALAGGWAEPRKVTSLAAPRPPQSPSPTRTPFKELDGSGADGVEGRAGVRIVAAAAGFCHTAFVTDEGRLYLFGEGAAVAGGDLSVLEGRVNATGLRESEGLVRRPEDEGGVDPLAVSVGRKHRGKGHGHA